MINASINKIWDIVSDLDQDTRYWKGIKNIKNITKKNNKTTREITLTFKNQKCMQDIIVYPKTKIICTFTKGIINGTKILNMYKKDKKIEIQIVWNIEFTGWRKIFSIFIKNHIKNGTYKALNNIKIDTEL